MSKLVKVFIITISLAIACIGSFVMYRTINTREQIEIEINSPHWQNRVNDFKNDRIDSSSIIFLGDSQTERFDLSIFNNKKIVNRGINGDFTEGILLRLEEVIKNKSSKIFIQIGVNDLVENVSVSTVLKNYEKIIQQIKATSPKTKIFVQSIFPTNLPSSLIRSSESLNQTIKEANIEIEKMCKYYELTYIDIYSKFILNGETNKTYLLADGIHLTKEGYMIWKETVERYTIE